MPKGYWIAHMTVTDPDKYPDYIETAKPAFQEYGARFIVRGGEYQCVEGNTGVRHVVIEFDSMEKAMACYRSEQYQKAIAIRQNASEGSITIVEGTE